MTLMENDCETEEQKQNNEPEREGNRRGNQHERHTTVGGEEKFAYVVVIPLCVPALFCEGGEAVK